jgi:hypothetical protein
MQVSVWEMDGHAGAKRRVDDPLALTLGSIYAAAPTPPPRSTRRRLNDTGSSARAVRPCTSIVHHATAADNARQAAPFPWATESPARHDTLASLLRRVRPRLPVPRGAAFRGPESCTIWFLRACLVNLLEALQTSPIFLSPNKYIFIKQFYQRSSSGDIRFFTTEVKKKKN